MYRLLVVRVLLVAFLAGGVRSVLAAEMAAPGGSAIAPPDSGGRSPAAPRNADSYPWRSMPEEDPSWVVTMRLSGNLTAMPLGARVPATRQGWESDYRPAGGSMSTVERNGYNAGLAVEVEPVFRLGSGLCLGIPISYAHTFTPIKVRDVQWWDQVPLTALTWRQQGPGIGLSLQRGDWKLRMAAHGYRLVKEEYRGVDKAGAQNEAEVISRAKVESGVGVRADIRRTFLGRMDIGVYYQHDGDVGQSGLSAGWSMPLAAAR